MEGVQPKVCRQTISVTYLVEMPAMGSATLLSEERPRQVRYANDVGELGSGPPESDENKAKACT